jgi:hypothetical protein
LPRKRCEGVERRKALVFHVARPRIAAAFARTTRLGAGVLFGEGRHAFRRSAQISLRNLRKLDCEDVCAVPGRALLHAPPEPRETPVSQLLAGGPSNPSIAVALAQTA